MGGGKGGEVALLLLEHVLSRYTSFEGWVHVVKLGGNFLLVVQC